MFALVGAFFWNLFLFKRGDSPTDHVRKVLHTLFLGWLLIVLSQQLALYYEIYNEKLAQYAHTQQMWHEEECATYSGRSVARQEECRQWAIILANSPCVTALSTLVGQWNSCLTMSCTELVLTISNNLQYKLLVILLSLAVASYLWKFLSCTRKKYRDFSDDRCARLNEQQLDEIMKTVRQANPSFQQRQSLV